MIYLLKVTQVAEQHVKASSQKCVGFCLFLWLVGWSYNLKPLSGIGLPLNLFFNLEILI